MAACWCRDGNSILFTDPRYRIQPLRRSRAVKIAKGPLLTEVARAIARLGLKRIGYEPARMTCDAYESLSLDSRCGPRSNR